MLVAILLIFIMLSSMLNAYLIYTKVRYDGKIVVTKSQTSGRSLFSLEFDNVDPYEIQNMKFVIFKVENKLSLDDDDSQDKHPL